MGWRFVISKDVDHAERVASQRDCGMAFINHLPDSAPNLLLAGVTRSGFRRDFRPGNQEFANWRLMRAA
ncbi:hypothetical protein AXA44_43660 [Rhodococcus sp. SC4]|jgi:acyl-CoA reductase-like NAD-dependent aldehyde dehydrogenase|nr:hypothetical protein AXA44_43660 [Rhodococcus sp. SC4]